MPGEMDVFNTHFLQSVKEIWENEVIDLSYLGFSSTSSTKSINTNSHILFLLERLIHQFSSSDLLNTNSYLSELNTMMQWVKENTL